MNTNYNYWLSRYPQLYQPLLYKQAAQGPDPAMMGGAPPMDPAMMGGAPPMDPAMMGGAPPMDPAMMGGAPPMDPAMMGGLPPMPPPAPAMPPADPATTEAKVSNKVKTEQWMSHIDSYCYNMLNLMIELFNQLNLKIPSEALLPKPLDQNTPSAEELSNMMASSTTTPVDQALSNGAGEAVPPDISAMLGGGGIPPMEAKTSSYEPQEYLPINYADLLNKLSEY